MNAYANLLTTTDRLVAELAPDGWRHATAAELSQAVGIHAVRIDGDVANDSTCDECQHVGAHFVPFLQAEVQPGRTHRAYRAFAVQWRSENRDRQTAVQAQLRDTNAKFEAGPPPEGKPS